MKTREGSGLLRRRFVEVKYLEIRELWTYNSFPVISKTINKLNLAPVQINLEYKHPYLIS